MLTLEKNGNWELPGGGLDFGEKSAACLAREIKEEMGLEVVIIKERPAYFFTTQHSNGVWSAHVLHEIKTKDLEFTPSAECVELRFFTCEEAVEEKISPNVAEFIKIYRPGNHELEVVR